MPHERTRLARHSLLGISALALLTSAPALAQDAAPAEEEDSGDIIVTARQFEERLQDIPVVVTSISREDIERQQLDDLGDIAEKTVGFAFETFTGPLAQPVIRGQTNLRTTSPVQNVATNLNGIYLQRGYFVDQGLLDLERVEIIKGPQSALYGRNAFAGVISLNTRSPDLDDFSGRFVGTIGSDERYEARGALSVPVIPGRLAVYGAAAYAEFDGTWKNNHPLADAKGAFTRGKLGGYEKKSYQAGIKAKPIEAIELEATYIRTERELEQNPAYTISTLGLTNSFNTLNASPSGTGTVLTTGPGSSGTVLQNRLFVGEFPVRPLLAAGEPRLPGLVVDPRSYGLRGPSEIWIGRATLDTGGPVSIGYIYGRTSANIVARGSSQRDPLAPAIVFGTNFGTVFDSSGTESSFVSNSHEGRANFNFGSVTGFAGVNFTETSDAESNASEFAPVNSLTEPTGVSLFPLVPGGAIPTAIAFRRNTFLVRKENVFSAFGFVQWKPSDSLAISLEGRYTEERQRAIDRIAADVAPAFGGRGTGFLAPVPPQTTRDASFFTPRGSITYKFDDNHNVYVTVGKGYKSGGINGVPANFNRTSIVGGVPIVDTISPGAPPPAPRAGATSVTFAATTPGSPIFSGQATYDAETNWTYEIGSKNQFFDRQLTLNFSAYYTDWKDVQTNAVRLQPDGTAPANFAAIVPSLIGNVGDVRVYGVEVEGNWRVTPEIRIDFGASYNRARYKDGVVSQRIGASGNCIVATGQTAVCTPVADPRFTFPVLPIGGNQLERTPEFDALLGVSFDTKFSNDWGFFARADVTYQTKQFGDEANLSVIPDRTLVNASVGLEIGNINLNAWVKNLFDRKYVTSALFLVGTGGGGSATYVPILGEQRTLGLTASYKF